MVLGASPGFAVSKGRKRAEARRKKKKMELVVVSLVK
jgi:hypothetical protein